MKKTLSLFTSFLILVTSSFAQLTERTNMGVMGNYDVRMISSVALQPAWVSAVNPFQVISPLTDSEMKACGKYLSVNNYVSGLANAVPSITEAAYQALKPANAVGVAMVYADCDDDNSTFQSSSAYIDFGNNQSTAEISYAYLYWSGMDDTETTSYSTYSGLPTMKSHTGGATGQLSGIAYKTVKLKAPGDATYTDITASRLLGGGGRYICYADVTQNLKAKKGGTFWVGNIRSSSTKGSNGAGAGWTLVVVYTHPNCKARSIKFWDGFTNIGSTAVTSTFSLNMGSVPATSVIANMGIAALDGDNVAANLLERSASPDYIQLSSRKSTTIGQTYNINPFASGQSAPLSGEPVAPYACFDKDGNSLGTGYDGMFCSRITSFDSISNSNGNPITRLPSLENTLGYDSHHLRLPEGAIIPGATSISLKINEDIEGAIYPFLTYFSFESGSTTTSNDLASGKDVKISVSPNPVKDIVTISGFNGNASIQIKDIQGKVQVSSIVSANEGTSLNSLLPGIYFITIESEQGTCVKKIIKN